MLDTDTCIYAMSAADGFEPTLPLQDCAISVVVLGELELGVWRSQRVEHNRVVLDEWLTAVQVTAMNADVGSAGIIAGTPALRPSVHLHLRQRQLRLHRERLQQVQVRHDRPEAPRTTASAPCRSPRPLRRAGPPSPAPSAAALSEDSLGSTV